MKTHQRPINPNNRYTLILGSNQDGFTLIELLIAVIIIGVLSAIALPSYLNQTAKARGSEAKANLGSINRSQQAYRWEYRQFADQMSSLDIKVPSKYHRYSILSGNTTDTATVTISQRPDLKVVSGAITQNNDIFTQIICESTNTQSVNTTATSPTGGGGVALGCPANYKIVN
jgi:type IV pilus assembly protein PilA